MSKGYDGWKNDYFDPEYDDEDADWEHMGRCPSCGVDSLFGRYDDETGDTEQHCEHCDWHGVSYGEPDEKQAVKP
jgi:hypothetical protein